MTVKHEQTMDEWIESIPEILRSDPLWESVYYRLAMYMYDLAWDDCEQLRIDIRGREIYGQLIRSAGSICANIEEAFGRGIGSADYVRIMRIALGEAREARGWYTRSRRLLSEDLLDRRLKLASQIIALLINTISRHRSNLKTP